MSTFGLPTGKVGGSLESPDSNSWDMRAVTNWDLCHSSHMVTSHGQKGGTSKAYVKVDIQFDKVKRYQE